MHRLLLRVCMKSRGVQGLSLRLHSLTMHTLSYSPILSLQYMRLEDLQNTEANTSTLPHPVLSLRSVWGNNRNRMNGRFSGIGRRDYLTSISQQTQYISPWRLFTSGVCTQRGQHSAMSVQPRSSRSPIPMDTRLHKCACMCLHSNKNVHVC